MCSRRRLRCCGVVEFIGDGNLVGSCVAFASVGGGIVVCIGGGVVAGCVVTCVVVAGCVVACVVVPVGNGVVADSVGCVVAAGATFFFSGAAALLSGGAAALPP